MRVFVFLLVSLVSAAAVQASVASGSGTADILAQAGTPLAPPPLPDTGSDLTTPDPNASEDDGSSPDNLSIGDIPVIETMEITPEIARKALDVYFLATEKYEAADLEAYDNLQDFVDQNPAGKNFEADVKAAGFANVMEWNTAFTAVGFAYAAIVDDQTSDIEAQIADLEADTEIATDMKDRMIASLRAMIPSDNNKKVIEDLLDDPVYGDKLKQLDLVEE
ncbi:MAG: hypothetical protein NTU78_10245 [Alphaproteobacteria bacterium]|nr:hypothetical protein [Alphaproteobacteria bacterium]